ncbi:hypothetical protein L916_03201 [Phytophthora nicotianae]|uniref:Uncharacterized protein n=1 Tax=Phytophthora nicotianae TaxID=4792 RepID=W2JKV1_PHYNI|nr:hypothetical protein L916_03201 [Phytophthora nicotianae]
MKHLETKTLPKKPTRTIINHERERVPYSTGLQRRKRAETRKLRIEAKVLTAQLAQLKRRRQEHIKNASALSSGIQRQHMINWRSVAAVACEQRQIAERINCELKAIMADQESVRSSVLQVLVKTNAINLKSLYNEKSRVFSVVDTSTLVSYRCQTSPLLNCMEITSSTPMTYSVHETGDWLWSYIITTRKNAVNSIDKTMQGPLDMTGVLSRREGLQILNNVSAFRRFNEGDQIFVVGSAMWFLPSAGLVLQDNNWTVISPSPTNPEYKCVVRNCYKLEATPVSAANTQTQKATLDLVGNRMRIIIQSMQDTLLGHDERSSTYTC